MNQDDIEHLDDCQLDLDGAPGLCTCDFDKRMRAAGRARDFVKCTDPLCDARGLNFGGGLLPHCHPIF